MRSRSKPLEQRSFEPVMSSDLVLVILVSDVFISASYDSTQKPLLIPRKRLRLLCFHTKSLSLLTRAESGKRRSAREAISGEDAQKQDFYWFHSLVTIAFVAFYVKGHQEDV